MGTQEIFYFFHAEDKMFAKIIDESLKKCVVGLGTNEAYYKKIGMTEMDVEQGVDGAWYLKGYAPKKSLDEAKSVKLTEINAACDNILNAAVSTYPETEVLTFDQQTSEARAYLASQNPSDAPLLTALAAGRGITLDDLVQRVIAKHDAFSQLSGYVIGQRQALEDKLDLCQSVEDVEAIVVDIKLPDTSQEEEATEE